MGVNFIGRRPARPMYSNPIIGKGNTPDPTVLQYGRDRYGHKIYDLVTTTEGNRNGLQVRQSTDLVHWRPSRARTIFNSQSPRPRWATSNTFWAPELYHFDGRFVLYFATDHAGKKCIGAVTSRSIDGPWHDPLGKPLLQLPGKQSSIDPVVLRDPVSRKSYLYYTVQPNQIYVQPMRRDGLGVQPGSKPTLVLQAQDQVDAQGNVTPDPAARWEMYVNEGPEPFYKNGWYYLLYSGARTQDGSYAIGVARSRSPMGPFDKHGAPVLSGDGKFDGTGHDSRPFVGPDGRTYILHHGYLTGHENYRQRHLFLEPMTIGPDGWPRLGTAAQDPALTGPGHPVARGIVP